MLTSTYARSFLFSLFSSFFGPAHLAYTQRGNAQDCDCHCRCDCDCEYDSIEAGQQQTFCYLGTSIDAEWIFSSANSLILYIFFVLRLVRFVCAAFPPRGQYIFSVAFLVHSVFPFGPAGASERLSRMPHRELLVNSIHGLTLMELLTVCAIRQPLSAIPFLRIRHLRPRFILHLHFQ